MQTKSSDSTPRLEYRIFPALIVIAIGVIFLLRNLGVEIPFLEGSNWWAWFILVGAVAPLSRAYETWQARGRVDADVIYPLLMGVAVALVAVMFLLGLEWRVWWPLFVILGGLISLVRGPSHRRSGHRRRHASQDADDTRSND